MHAVFIGSIIPHPVRRFKSSQHSLHKRVWDRYIFIRYCKEDTCYTLVDLYCTFDSYIVYCGSSKKVLTALLTLADCVGSLNRLSAVSRFSPR